MNIKTYLPSGIFARRIAFIVILAIIIFTIPKLWSWTMSLFKDRHITPEQASIIASIDTDGDGVFDWQEKLWGTDINNKSTFGIDDKEYISKKQTELDTTDEQADNNTDILSKQLFATINAIKADGTLNQEEVYKEIADNVAQYVTDNPTNNAQKIAISDISTVPDSKENLKAYGKSISGLSGTFFGNNSVIGNETNIIYYALVNEDATHLQDLDPIIDAYNKLAEKMTAIKAPKSIAADHTQMVNTLYVVSNTLTETKSLFSDTVVGIRGVVEYNKAMTDLDSIIDRLQTYVSN